MSVKNEGEEAAGEIEEEVDDKDNVCLINGPWFFWGCKFSPQRHKSCVHCKCDGCRNKDMARKRGGKNGQEN